MSSSEIASAASAAFTAVPASAPASSALLFKSEATDVGFPWAGAALLLLLVALAVAARWQALRSGGHAPEWLRRWMGAGANAPVAAPGAALALQSSIRLDAQTQLHVVQWDGRQLLVATSANASPVLLDRSTPAGSATEGRS